MPPGGRRLARIMVVEDEEAIVELYTHMLELTGHRVVAVARDGEEALVRLRGEDPLPDLILLDHRMPGVTGLQVLSAMPERAAGVPVILVTADAAATGEARRLGVVAVLVKPFPMDRLISEVEGATGGPSAGRDGGQPASA